MLSIASRCLTLAFAFPGESKNSDDTRPGKVNPRQTLTLKADTPLWGLKISKPNLRSFVKNTHIIRITQRLISIIIIQRLISIIIIRFIAS